MLQVVHTVATNNSGIKVLLRCYKQWHKVLLQACCGGNVTLTPNPSIEMPETSTMCTQRTTSTCTDPAHRARDRASRERTLLHYHPRSVSHNVAVAASTSVHTQ